MKVDLLIKIFAASRNERQTELTHRHFYTCQTKFITSYYLPYLKKRRYLKLQPRYLIN